MFTITGTVRLCMTGVTAAVRLRGGFVVVPLLYGMLKLSHDAGVSESAMHIAVATTRCDDRQRAACRRKTPAQR